MKKLVLLMMIVCMAIPCFGQATMWNIYGKPTSDWFSGNNTYRDVPHMWMKAVDPLIAGARHGRIYYVDGVNGDASNDGSSWERAFSTLTLAIAASNTDIAITANAFNRNIIFVGGVGYTEDMVLMAKYCDIVGVGAMQPYINGTWVIPNAAANAGCHFYNLTFIDDGAGGAIFDITGQAGIEFHGCRIAYQTTDDYGIVLENCRPFLIQNCMVGAYGTGPGDLGFALAAIKITDGTNTVYDGRIRHCHITSMGIGVDWDETAASNCWIEDNYIYGTEMAIDEESDHVRVINNVMVSEGSMEDSYDFNITRASGNVLTAAEGTYNVPVISNDNGHFQRMESRGADGKVFYVNTQITTTGDGLSWATAYKTLTEAVTASNTDIVLTAPATNTFKRNTIYFAGMGTTENFTTLAKYCDIVGVGSPQPYVCGTWTIENATACAGCRFYNMTFIDDTGSGAIFDVTGQAGVEWHNCRIAYSATEDYGILIENCRPFLVKDCLVGAFGTGPGDLGFSLAAIKVVDGTNTLYDCNIKNCTITSLGIGIDWDEDATSNCWISDNYIYAQGMTIDEEGDKVRVINNRLITEIDTGTSTVGYDFSLAIAAGNIQTGSGGETDTVPFTLIAEP